MKRCFEAPGNVIGRGINPAAIQGMLVQSLHFETPGLLRSARNEAVPAVIARRLWARGDQGALHFTRICGCWTAADEAPPGTLVFTVFC